MPENIWERHEAEKTAEVATDDELDKAYRVWPYMHPVTERHLRETYTGHQGPVTMTAIARQIPPQLWGDINRGKLTGRQMGLIWTAVNNAYHAGRAAAGCEVIDGEAVYINKLGHLYELEDIAKLQLAIGSR